MNTAVKQDALDQLKPIAYFDPYKGNNASPKQNTDAKPGKAVAPKNMRVKENMQKPELDVTHQRMASSIAKKLKTMSPDELKQTLSALDITPENFHEVAKSSFEILGEDNSAELFKSLLAENGMTPQDVKKALQTPEFLNALGVNADVSPGSGELDSIKTLMHHLSSAFEGNPYLLILTLSDKSDRINYQVQGSALKGMQTVTNSMHETTKGLNENISDTKKQEQENDDKHWWQKALDIIVPILATVVIMVGIQVVCNFILPVIGSALGSMLDGLVATAMTAFDIGGESVEVGEELAEMGEEVGKEAKKGTKTVEKGSKAAEDASEAAEDSTDLVPEEEQEAFSQLGDQGDSKVKEEGRIAKARRKLGDAVSEMNDLLANAKQAVSDSVDKVTEPVKDYVKDSKLGRKASEFSDGYGKKIGEMQAKGLNYGEKGSRALSNFMEKYTPSLKKALYAGVALGIPVGVMVGTMLPASNQNAKLQLLQAEANIMNEGLQADKLNLDAAQNITSQAQQGIQANGYTGSWAINNMMNLMKI